MTRPKQEPSTFRLAVDMLAILVSLALMGVAIWGDEWTEAIFWGLVHAWTITTIRRREGL